MTESSSRRPPPRLTARRWRPRRSPHKPLPQHLDEFFLNGLAFNKTPLRDAVRQMEAQLRSLNFAHSSDLARLRVSLPAEAMNREVTFQSDSISFLKALRAIAALAGCEVAVSDNGIALNTLMDGMRQPVERRAIESLLAADGIGRHASLSDLLTDAQALGMVATEDRTLDGTPAQFAALAQLAESRRQIRQMPDMSFLAFMVPSNPQTPSHVLTPAEQKALAEKATAAPSITVDPGAAPVQGSDKQPDIQVTAVPAGDGVRLTLTPKLADNGLDSLPDGLRQQLPIDIILPRGGGASITVPLAPPIQTIAAAPAGQVPSSTGRWGATLDSGLVNAADGTGAFTLSGASLTSPTTTVGFNDITNVANFAALGGTNANGTIVKNGAGAVTLGSSNTINGNIIVNQGTLTLAENYFASAGYTFTSRTATATGQVATFTNAATGAVRTITVAAGASLILTPAPTPGS